MPTADDERAKLILLVDDDDDVREVTRVSLELIAGYRVVTASSGPEALRQARQYRPDGILLDMMMPGVDGLETLERLGADPETAGIKVILLTARVDGTPPPDSIAGAIRKPFDPMRLGAEVARLMGWAQ